MIRSRIALVRRVAVVVFLMAGGMKVAAQEQSAPIKLCVAMINSHISRPLNTRFQQDRLIAALTSAKKDKKGKLATVDPIPLQNEDPAQADPEARNKGCGYVLYTKVVILGEIPTTGHVGAVLYNDKANFQTQVEYQLYSLGEPKPILTGSAVNLQEDPLEESVAGIWNRIAKQTRTALAGK